MIKVTKKFNGLFWIQIFFTLFTFFFLPVFEKMRELFFLAISISVLTDAGAYYVGVKIGKTKIFPKTKSFPSQILSASKILPMERGPGLEINCSDLAKFFTVLAQNTCPSLKK